MKVKPNNYIAIEFPSRSVNEGLARAAVAAFAAQLDPTLDELGDIKTAVSEAVTNAIVHAYPQEIGKIALRACIFDGNLLEITVRDWGCGIADVEKAREPLYTTGGEERSGMGFTIMESFMDSLAVRSKNGKGTVVTKKRTARRGTPRRNCSRPRRRATSRPASKCCARTAALSGASCGAITAAAWSRTTSISSDALDSSKQ